MELIYFVARRSETAGAKKESNGVEAAITLLQFHSFNLNEMREMGPASFIIKLKWNERSHAAASEFRNERKWSWWMKRCWPRRWLRSLHSLLHSPRLSQFVAEWMNRSGVSSALIQSSTKFRLFIASTPSFRSIYFSLFVRSTHFRNKWLNWFRNKIK